MPRKAPPGFVTHREAAAALGIPLSRVQAWIDQAQAGNPTSPVFVKIGRKVFQVAGRPLGSSSQ